MKVVRGAARLLNYDPRLQGIRLELDLDAGLPAIFGSADQLTQVIFNLLVNAEHACSEMPRGEGLIRVATQANNGGVWFCVEDNGCGMDEPALARAFEPYFTTRTSGDGLGLGLSLCRSILAEHAGTCSITSEPGKGTTVNANLPLNCPVDAEEGLR